MNVSHAESTTLHEAWGTSAFPIGVDSDSGSDTSAALCLESGFSGTYLTTLILHSSYIIHFIPAHYCLQPNIAQWKVELVEHWSWHWDEKECGA